jgi:hypothetical protein
MGTGHCLYYNDSRKSFISLIHESEVTKFWRHISLLFSIYSVSFCHSFFSRVPLYDTCFFSLWLFFTLIKFNHLENLHSKVPLCMKYYVLCTDLIVVFISVSICNTWFVLQTGIFIITIL